MALSAEQRTALLNLIFTNAAMANVGDASGLQPSGAAGNFYVSLHTADPGTAGDQSTNEIAYTGYARVAVVRSGSGWSVSGDTATNVAAVTFPACTGLTATATYYAVGSAATGSAGHRLWPGQITSPAGGLAISNGITPSFAAGQMAFTVD